MPLSANGYSAGDRSLIVTVTVPGTGVSLPVRKGPTGALLIAAAARWHREVEPLMVPGCWGYAYRSVRGSTTELSNHASGTAIDLNAPKHPLGTNPSMNFTPDQIAAVRKIIADAKGALRWGGDYVGRKDGMHLEVNADEAACAAALPALMTVPPTHPPVEDAVSWTHADGAPPVPDLYPGRPQGATLADPLLGLAWAIAHAAVARDLAGQALAEVKALRADVAALRTALGK